MDKKMIHAQKLAVLMDKRIYKVLVLLFGPILMIILVIRVNLTLDRIIDANSSAPRAITIMRLMEGVFLQMDTMVVGFILLIILFLYLKTIDFELSIPLNSRKLMNSLVSLFILTFFIIPVPGIFLSFALFLLCILVPRRNRIQSNMRPFWIIVGGFVILETIALVSMWLGFGEIRKNIPYVEHLLNMTPFLNAFTVYYVIKRNNWGLGEFEMFFKILIYCTAIVAVESVVTFYLGIGKDINIFGYSPLRNGMFQSMFIGSYHVAGRLGMTLLFMGIYFLSKYRQIKYLFFCILGSLLLFSTLKLQIIISSVIGFVLWLLLAMEKRREVNVARNVLNFYSAVIILLIFACASIYLADYIRLLSGRIDPAIGGLIRRSIRVARATDVFLYNFPLGTGVDMTGYFMGSLDIPWDVSKRVGQFLNYDFTNVKHLIVLSRENFKYGLRVGFSVHNLWVRTILEFGLLGLIFIVYLWWKGWKMFVHLYRLQKGAPLGIGFSPIWAVFVLVFSISLSVFFTDKFRNYWYFGLLFAFLELCCQDVSSQLKRLDSSRIDIK